MKPRNNLDFSAYDTLQGLNHSDPVERAVFLKGRGYIAQTYIEKYRHVDEQYLTYYNLLLKRLAWSIDLITV